MQDRLDPITLILTAFGVGALSGVAALLRTTKRLSVRALLSAGLNSGAIGAALAMLLFTYFKDNVWFLLGLCMLAGLGGMTVIGAVITVAKQGGFNVKVNFQQKDKEEGDDA